MSVRTREQLGPDASEEDIFELADRCLEGRRYRRPKPETPAERLERDAVSKRATDDLQAPTSCASGVGSAVVLLPAEKRQLMPFEKRRLRHAARALAAAAAEMASSFSPVPHPVPHFSFLDRRGSAIPCRFPDRAVVSDAACPSVSAYTRPGCQGVTLRAERCRQSILRSWFGRARARV